MKRILLLRGAELIVFGLLATIPLVVINPYALGLLTLLAIYGILLIGLDVTVGYLGQVNLAHVAFLGLGAYAAFGTEKALLAGLAAPAAVRDLSESFLRPMIVRAPCPTIPMIPETRRSTRV